MPVTDPVDPIENIEHVVSLFRAVSDRGERKRLLKEVMRGTVDHDSPEGRAVGARRVFLCARLREEELWP